MDQHSNLWLELIFPHCADSLPTLLALRAACTSWRVFLGTLRAHPFWIAHTLLIPWMTYEERALGWQGVESGMAREERTRANCDAGRGVYGVKIPYPAGVAMGIIAERIVRVSSAEGIVQLLEPLTGDIVADLVVPPFLSFHQDALLDRWLIMYSRHYSLVTMVDCVNARVVPPVGIAMVGGILNLMATSLSITSAGPRFSVRQDMATYVDVIQLVNVDKGDLCFVKTVTLHDGRDRIFLCNRGASYVVYEYRTEGIHLMDIATGLCTRTFAQAKTPQAHITNFQLTHPESNYIIIAGKLCINTKFQKMIVRISDGRIGISDNYGNCSIVQDALGHIMSPTCQHYASVQVIDVVGTGGVVRSLDYPMADGSGAAIYVERSYLYTRGNSDQGSRLMDVSASDMSRFLYGICVTRTTLYENNTSGWQVIRFDLKE